MTNKALQPVEQKTVLFYDDEITAVRLQDGSVYSCLCPARGWLICPIAAN